MRIRIHKDIMVRWTIKTNGQDVPLTGRDIAIVLTDPYEYRRELAYEVESGNVAVLTWRGMDQSKLGNYTISAVENCGKPSESAVDAVNFVTLVARTDEEDQQQSAEGLDTEGVTLTGNIQIITGNTTDFDLLVNRPKYDGAVMTHLTDIKPAQRATMPTAADALLGAIYQYIGATTENYTNGFFYKCVSDGEETPTYSWSVINIQPVAATDFDQLVNRPKYNGVAMTHDTNVPKVKNVVFIDIVRDETEIFITDVTHADMVAMATDGRYIILRDEDNTYYPLVGRIGDTYVFGNFDTVESSEYTRFVWTPDEKAAMPMTLYNFYGSIPKNDLSSLVQTSLGKADTALQPSDLSPYRTSASQDVIDGGKVDKVTGMGLSHNDYSDAEKAKVTAAGTDIDAIEAKIPAQATAQNQLADKDFVNSSIATSTATFRGSVYATNDTEAAAQTALATITGMDNNDYANVIVQNTPEVGVDKYKRYTYNGAAWIYNYSVNTTGFTSAQWNAINSGATAEQIAAIAGKYVKPNTGIPESDLATAVQNKLAAINDKMSKPVSETYNISSWSDLSASDPFSKKADIAAVHTIGVSTVVELINNNAIAFANYGFQIGAVNGQMVTIYAIEEPTAAVSLTINYYD